MKKQILYVGLDVDDQAYHGHARAGSGTEEFEFKCKSSSSALAVKLQEFTEKGYEVKSCYEATYLGFSLRRELKKAGFECEVIAPSLIPKKPGDRVKTDKLDSRNLSEYFKNNQLTIVRVPNEEQESVRDLVRSRVFLKKQTKGVKLHILALCRRLGWRYREAGKTTSYWTGPHRAWLEKEIKQIKDRALKFNFVQLTDHLKILEQQIKSYDSEIEAISRTPDYKSKVDALRCYRGIDSFTAMIFATEIWDANRFAHPRQLTAYAGLKIKEDTSGGHEKKYRITKMGNPFLRTAAVEVCQSVFTFPKISKRLKQSRLAVDKKYIDIADRCMRRLHKKSTHMLYSGKQKNKIKVACARELLCFIWESLKAAA